MNILDTFWFWFINQQDSLTNMFADVYYIHDYYGVIIILVKKLKKIMINTFWYVF